MEKTDTIIAQAIRPTPEALVIRLPDREVCVPWHQCSPRLAAAGEDQRMYAVLSPGGYGVHWPLIDEDLSVAGLVRAT